LPQFHAVGFSGHRHLADPAGTARAIGDALDALRAQVPGEWIAFSSIARGGDQLFVRQARAIGLSWHAILPLSHAEFATDFTPDEWSAVEETLATADHLKVITENGDRKDAYLDCGIETVNGSDVLIAVWDGDSARGKGGTAEIVEYAKTTGKPVMIIDAITHEMRKENWDRLEPNDAVLDDLNGLPEAASAWAVNPFKAPDVALARAVVHLLCPWSGDRPASQDALAPQLGALPARCRILSLGPGHLGTAASRSAAAQP
jgi:hypothetical protein